MNRQLLVLLLFFGLTSALYGQDIIYTLNGSKLDGAQLVDVTEDKVSFSYQNQVRSFQRQNILFAFRQNGNYLVISELDGDLVQAEQQLRTFLYAPPRADGYDYLIKAVPLTVIPAKISYSGPDAINYQTVDNKSASISKNELVTILYRDGKHTVLRSDFGEAAPLLVAAHDKIRPDAASVNPTPTEDKVVEHTPIPISSPLSVPPSAPATTTATVATIDSRKVLTENERRDFQDKAIKKVDKFVEYLNNITNKALPLSVRDQAIDNATKLFMPAATMEVTSNSRPGSRKYPIRDYLVRLKLLPYSSTKIEWSEVHFVKELTQAADGNYYGLVEGKQYFEGTSRTGTYIDNTDKNVRVKVTKPDSEYDRWDLKLGSIGVSHQ